MTTPAPITNHYVRAILTLPGPFWGKPRIAALTKALALQVQAAEDALHGLRECLDIDTCDETRAGLLGRIVGQGRGGLDLPGFRAAIRARVLANRANGSARDLLDVANALQPAATWTRTDPVLDCSMIEGLGLTVGERMAARDLLADCAQANGGRVDFLETDANALRGVLAGETLPTANCGGLAGVAVGTGSQANLL